MYQFLSFSFFSLIFCEILPGASVIKEYACNVGDLGLILGLGRCSGEGDGKPFQHSYLENPHGHGGLEGCSPWGCRVGNDWVTKHTGVNNLPACAGDTSSIPGLERAPREGNDNSLLYSCLGNPMDRGAWQATVLGVAKSWTQLSD